MELRIAPCELGIDQAITGSKLVGFEQVVDRFLVLVQFIKRVGNRNVEVGVIGIALQGETEFGDCALQQSFIAVCSSADQMERHRIAHDFFGELGMLERARVRDADRDQHRRDPRCASPFFGSIFRRH